MLWNILFPQELYIMNIYNQHHERQHTKSKPKRAHRKLHHRIHHAIHVPNVARDRRVSRSLRAKGWRVFRIREHRIRSDAQKLSESCNPETIKNHLRTLRPPQRINRPHRRDDTGQHQHRRIHPFGGKASDGPSSLPS